MSVRVEVIDLAVTYTSDGVRALGGVSFVARPGELLVVLGPSGCGKTTLLSVIAGLFRHRRDARVSGRVLIDGVDVLNGPAKIRIGYVTQRDTLLPWRNVLGNVELGLEVMGVPREKRRALAMEFLEKVGLAAFKHSYPHELSGGMRKRVQLARTLVYRPDVLLMDEPFSSLDVQTRMMLHEELLDLWRKHRTTIIFVTHDIDEAITLADRIVLLTARPATVKDIYSVGIPRPRNVHDIKLLREFWALYEEIWRGFREEVAGGRGAR